MVNTREPASETLRAGTRHATWTWAQQVMADCAYLSGRLQAIRGRLGLLSPHSDDNDRKFRENQEWCTAIALMIRNAECAAMGVAPKRRFVASAWSGNCIEAAFKNLHYAEAALARLYSPDEIKAAVPEALHRVDAALDTSNPIRLHALELLRTDRSVALQISRGKEVRMAALSDESSPRPCSPEYLSEIISLGHQASDRHRSRLRSFRNVVIAGTILAVILLCAFLIVISRNPSVVPLCFVPNPTPEPPAPAFACPTREGAASPAQLAVPAQLATGGDVLAVAAMGLLGGSLSSAIFIRGLYANSTPYNVAVPLALLKLPAGATAALLGILLVAGDFVPGFSAIDRQTQILGYSVVFGFAQQLFTQWLDQRGKNLVANVPTKAGLDDNRPTDRSDP